MAQWFRICLPTQGTWVRALVWEDPTCRGATKPASHNYWACVPQLLKPVRLEPILRNKRSHRSEKPVHCKEEQPPLDATRESPRTATKTQHSQKKKKALLKIKYLIWTQRSYVLYIYTYVYIHVLGVISLLKVMTLSSLYALFLLCLYDYPLVL